MAQDTFTTSPILRNPDPSRPFLVKVDASELGIGAVLFTAFQQETHVTSCGIFFQETHPSRQNYDTGNQELLAVKLMLEEWRL